MVYKEKTLCNTLAWENTSSSTDIWNVTQHVHIKINNFPMTTSNWLILHWVGLCLPLGLH